MIEPAKRFVLDAYAILVYIQDEKEASKIEDILRLCAQKRVQAFMSTINLGEVYYKTLRGFDRDTSEKVMASLRQLPMEIVHPDEEMVWSAARIKAEHPISYADCFAVALAIEKRASIITGDPDFKRVKSLIRIEWL